MVDVTKGSGNVFEDLGFEPIEAADLKARADLMLKLREFIRSQHWTKAKAALFFDQPKSRIIDLKNGEIEHFTVEQLVQLLLIAGIDAHISIKTANELDCVSIDPEFELGMRAYEKVTTKYADALQELAE